MLSIDGRHDDGSFVHYGFGMRVISNMDLPFWPDASGFHILNEVRLRVKRTRCARSLMCAIGRTSEVRTGSLNRWESALCTYLNWEHRLNIAIDLGSNRVAALLESQLSVSHLSFALSGPVVSLLSIARGALPFHAGCVSVDGVAYLVVGEKGFGKSTLIASWLNAGAQFIADDQVIVRFSSDRPPYTCMSQPIIRLFPDSLERMGLDPNDYPRMVPETQKRAAWNAKKWTCAEGEMRVGGVFLLRPEPDRGATTIELQSVAGGEAIRRLHQSVAAHGVLSPEESASTLQACGDLVKTLNVVDVSYSHDVHKPVDVARLMADNVSDLF